MTTAATNATTALAAATSTSNKKHKFLRRRSSHAPPSDDEEEQRVAILQSSPSASFNPHQIMDTRSVTILITEQQLEQQQQQQIQQGFGIIHSLPTPMTATASAMMTTTTAKKPKTPLPILQPNVRDSRKKADRSPLSLQQQQPPLQQQRKVGLRTAMDPEGARGAPVATTPPYYQQQQRHPQLHSQPQSERHSPLPEAAAPPPTGSTHAKSATRSIHSTTSSSHNHHHRSPSHTVAKQQQQHHHHHHSPPDYHPVTTTTATTTSITSSMLSTFGEEVTLSSTLGVRYETGHSNQDINDDDDDNANDRYGVQHLSPISTEVIQQQQQQKLFPQKQGSVFHNKKNRPTDNASSFKTTTTTGICSSIVSNFRENTQHRPSTPRNPAAGNVVATAKEEDSIATHQTPPSRAIANKGGHHNNDCAATVTDKQLTVTPIQTNRSLLLDLEQQQQQRHRRLLLRQPPPSQQILRSQRNNINRPPAALIKAALSRPFGRDSSIPLQPPEDCSWVVEVSTAEWDTGQQQWKYRILVQKRQSAAATPPIVPLESAELPRTSFTAAFTWRSVADFFWLERALQEEFHGTLLLPCLSIALGRTVSVASEMPMESMALKYWLTDVLNGVRGSGEWILPIILAPHPPQQNQEVGGRRRDSDLPPPIGVNVMNSDSMETFLYRNVMGSTLGDVATNMAKQLPSPTRDNAESGHPVYCGGGESGDHDPSSFMSALLKTAMAVSPLELCGGQDTSNLEQQQPKDSSKAWQSRTSFPKPKLPLDVLNCSSRALGTATDLEIQDSFMESTVSVTSDVLARPISSPQGSSALAIHSELVLAVQDLANNYRTTALKATEKLQILLKEEERVAVAWKRFAITLANLFTYEKEVENAHLGDSKVKRENMPFRKVERDTVDECLRLIARQKTDRSVPGLKALYAMLSAYIADLSSVKPSVDVYVKAIKQLSSSASAESASQSNNSGGITAPSSVSSSSSSPKISDGKSNGSSWEGLKEWTMKSLHKANRSLDPSIESDEWAQKRQVALVTQHEDLKSRLLTNERLLRVTLTTMFRTVPFRISRMAWRYWNTEASHCALMNSAAASLRSKFDIVTHSSVSKMLKRHAKEEKSDCAVEMELVQRIVNLGQRKKFPSGADGGTDGSVSTTSINNDLVEVDNDELSEERAKAIKRDRALDIARHRIGRWNAVLAMAMMEAVGVDDPNVRVEETTRDLRLVRKYAIGLRECLNRCIEAVHNLGEAITGNRRETTGSPNRSSQSSPTLPVSNSASNRLKVLRNDFLIEMTLLFSGTLVDVEGKETPKRSSASKAVLLSAGIDTSDPFCWIPVANAPSPRGSRSTLAEGRVGNLAVMYVNARDAQVEWLLSSLDGLFNEYFQRIEAIEGFVYMECVGIQLEKHFNAKRAKALSSFEKKTDLTTAMNLARRKRMPQLISELQTKMQNMGPDVSHTTVKESKEAHLESKNLKTSLHELAMRRLMRARETSTERAITIMSLWAKEEEINATEEIKALGEAMSALERSVCQEDIDRISHQNTKPDTAK